MFFIFLAAGRGMMKHLPKFGLVRSWYKFFMLLIIYGVNVAAFVAGLAKAADDVDETHKEFWANIQAFLMTLSYVPSAANCLHEPNEKEKARNVFKFFSAEPGDRHGTNKDNEGGHKKNALHNPLVENIAAPAPMLNITCPPQVCPTLEVERDEVLRW
ncbi:hypothetical protein RHGRI_021316 [Rhododendron griersonianum]|uniref:Uncharacterized protein n=1 Tax=Rhododendron griersonianum TaxID=479676 RepID=A0AAV6JL62_9ERIC|nr:hypothetical protein RHGRI_021316 [Rhododendron griersonianum]